jgi:hypothetical protein
LWGNLKNAARHTVDGPVIIAIFFYFCFFVSRTFAMAFTAPFLHTPAAVRALETRHFLLFFLMSVDIAKSFYKWLTRPAGGRMDERRRPSAMEGGGRGVGVGCAGGGGRRAEI